MGDPTPDEIGTYAALTDAVEEIGVGKGSDPSSTTRWRYDCPECSKVSKGYKSKDYALDRLEVHLDRAH